VGPAENRLQPYHQRSRKSPAGNFRGNSDDASAVWRPSVGEEGGVRRPAPNNVDPSIKDCRHTGRGLDYLYPGDIIPLYPGKIWVEGGGDVDQRDRLACTAFEGFRRIASGAEANVALKTKKVIDRGARGPILIFDDVTGEQLELDFRGTAADVVSRIEKTTCGQSPEADLTKPAGEGPRGPGRPRLGVVAREVTLLPRHWDWLSDQPGGASVALRKLVEEARRANEGRDRLRRSQESAYRFMSAMAGNLPGFEEASRALFARNPDRFEELTRRWPKDVRTHLARMVGEFMPVGTAS
jgi:hypothetical protein